MIEMGIVVGIGLLMILVKMSWRWRIRTLSSPLFVDALIFFVLLLIHWGTFSGVMVATVGAMTCSIVLSTARWLYGYTEAGVYQPGKFDVSSRLA